MPMPDVVSASFHAPQNLHLSLSLRVLSPLCRLHKAYARYPRSLCLLSCLHKVCPDCGVSTSICPMSTKPMPDVLSPRRLSPLCHLHEAYARCPVSSTSRGFESMPDVLSPQGRCLMSSLLKAYDDPSPQSRCLMTRLAKAYV